jgi:hypothetical protein
VFGYLAPQEYFDRRDPKSIRLRPHQPDDDRYRQLTRGYCALVDSIDDRFGRIADPYATRNLTDTPEVADLQHDLHDRTVRWARQFGDRVWSCADLERVSAENPVGFRVQSGELKGRPLDLILRPEAAGLLP